MPTLAGDSATNDILRLTTNHLLQALSGHKENSAEQAHRNSGQAHRSHLGYLRRWSAVGQPYHALSDTSEPISLLLQAHNLMLRKKVAQMRRQQHTARCPINANNSCCSSTERLIVQQMAYQIIKTMEGRVRVQLCR
ncbi:uncharacterized protein LOC131672753 isoform X2 [Phymastichus coffea]|uniref:uncharacterized protein LOC131672753 isoform X2 n=1 Tax=Phymastichus coffea TaxID=108790 RepID=UPI00273B5228|nr:uncharacterized protein LOC131672753 isoform X2 [Phymastichus coffea]